MRKIFNALIVAPLALVLIVFAVANRHAVTLSFDPFNTSDPTFSLTLPLFVIILGVAMLGVIAGGCASWLRQRHWRVAAKHHARDARHLRDELAQARMESRNAAPVAPLSPNLPALRDLTRHSVSPN